MERLSQAATILKAAAQEINVILSKNHSTINASVQVQLNKIISRLGFYTGTQTATAAAPEFKPVTRFMGVAINPSKALTVADLTPDKTEIEQLSLKVERLFDQIEDFTPDQILNSYDNAANEIVLRGVAKKAGITDYDTIPLNIPLIEQIIAAKEAAAAQLEDDDNIEKRLAEQEKLFSETSSGDDPDPVDSEGTGEVSLDPGADNADEDDSQDPEEAIEQIIAAKEAAAAQQKEVKKPATKKGGSTKK